MVAPIVTVTMNPAIDLSTSTDRVAATEKMRCAQPRTDPGGGGINVARTVLALGEPVLAVLPVGGPTGTVLKDLLERAAVPCRIISIDGSTRESFSVTDNESGRQFRFVLPGPTLTPAEWSRCLDAAIDAARSAQYVVASGSLPPGVPSNFYQALATRVAGAGRRFILDTSGEALRQLRHGAYLVKPSARELAHYVGHPLPDTDSRITAARELITGGVSELVVVSLGADGALVVGRDWWETVSATPVAVANATGAGDAMVAGLTVGFTRGLDTLDAMELGIAAASASLVTHGTNPGHPDVIANLLDARTTTPAPLSHSGD
ncbi:1-phosphofructokinase family hexose kinase [Nocardia flavorosea]|uniref:1-phosphofructokinase family hexose kinase n=1 Tax=Nocardia flavorosea TaxID=53429 RepID=UPI001B351994|nr:1-phosphofructokinase family hexose kinase [Nocardia flavorosea]